MRAQLLVNSLKLAATLTAPGLARLFVEHELRAWLLPEKVVDDARAIVSELVTNSVQFTGFAHPEPTYADLQHVALLAVQVRVRGRSLFVEVWDSGQESKYPPPMRDEDEHGRGLHIVRSLSADMGHASHTDGELVWAKLDVGPEFEGVSQVKPALHAFGSRYVISSLIDMTRADMALMSRRA